MKALRLRKALPGIALIAGMMAIALSCGDAAEPAYDTASSAARPQQQAASATAAPAAMSATTKESMGLDSSPMAQIAAAVQQEVEAAEAAQPASAKAGAAAGGSADESPAPCNPKSAANSS